MRAVQIDAPAVVRGYLRTVVEGIAFRSSLPGDWSPASGMTATVVGDGTSVSDRGWTRENVRVSVRGSVEPEVRRVAALCDAVLLEPGAVPGVSVVPGAGMIVTADDEFGGFIASVTVRVAATREVVGNG